MDASEIESIVKSVIDKMNADAEVGKKIPLNIGTVMKALGGQLEGKAQGGEIANAIKKIIGQ